MYKTCISFLILLFSVLWVSANETITRWEAFVYLAQVAGEDIPESYTYIDLYYSWVSESSQEGRALQKLVYLGLINNSQSNLWLAKDMDFYLFEALATKILDIKISEQISAKQKKNILVRQSDLESIDLILAERSRSQNSVEKIEGLPESSKILTDVYNTLNSSYYDRENIVTQEFIQWAIKWATDSLGDRYTTYFPPVESKSFNDNLDGSFQGIGAYIEMPTPGELIIISPIVDSPAENAGILWWDRVIAVDGKVITPDNSVSKVVSWIKWPKGSQVELTIQREWIAENIIISVTRDTIVIKDVEFEKISNDTYYIQIKSFWNNVTKEFREALDMLVADTNVTKIIFDVRNNPGWFLDQVNYMLSYFVPGWEPTAIIDYGSNQREFISRWYDLIDTDKYDFVFLQNWGSASASEIMVGTMKDYFPEMTIIGEKSFWKGSVQSLKNYYDGSTLKYTSAKWFTGKTATGIDGIWINPDILLPIDLERLRDEEYDNQLERAKRN